MPILCEEFYEPKKRSGYLSEAEKSAERFTKGIARERTAALNTWSKYDRAKPRARSSRSIATKKLKRDLNREALTRLEDSARTLEEYQEVIAHWDRLDANRERRERYHEICRDGESFPLEYGAAKNGITFPSALNDVLEKQLQSGDFLDLIHNCFYEIHELVTDESLSRILKKLSDEQKELLFFRVVRAYSSKRLGAMRGQTDRNIRKVTVTLFKRIHKEMLPILADRNERHLPMTKEERQFLAEMKKFPHLRKRIADVFSNVIAPAKCDGGMR